MAITHRIHLAAVLCLVMASGWGAEGGRLERFGGAAPPVVLEGADPEVWQTAILAWMATTFEGIDPQSAPARAMAEFAATGVSAPDGAGRRHIDGTHWDIGVDNFNHFRQIERQVRRQDLPPVLIEALVARYARSMIVDRVRPSIREDIQRLIRLPEGTALATPADGAELVDAIGDQWPDWVAASAWQRWMVVQAIQVDNADLETGRQMLVDDLSSALGAGAFHIALPMGGGRFLLQFYEFAPGTPLLIPPGSSLAGPAQVTALDLRGLPLSDCAVLADLPLEALDISYTDVAELAPLASLSGLRRLGIAHTRVSDLAPLRGLPLRSIDLRGTPVRDLTPLAGAPLVEVDASHSRVQDIAPLVGSGLERLVLRDVPIADLGPLSRASGLRVLDVHGTMVEDIAPLAGLDLQHLDVDRTRVSDLRPIEQHAFTDLVIDPQGRYVVDDPMSFRRRQQRIAYGSPDDFLMGTERPDPTGNADSEPASIDEVDTGLEDLGVFE